MVFTARGRQPELLRDAMASCEVRGFDVLVNLPPTVPSKGTMAIANVSGFDFPAAEPAAHADQRGPAGGQALDGLHRGATRSTSRSG